MATTQLKLVWQFLRLDPAIGARVLLNRNDIFARFAADALMVWRCTPVNVTKILWDYKIGEECFAILPVLVHVHNLSLELIWKNHAPKIIFDAPPIMSPQASVLTSTLAMLQGVMLNFERLELQFNHFVDNSNHLTLDPEIFKRSMRNIQNGQAILNRYCKSSHFSIAEKYKQF